MGKNDEQRVNKAIAVAFLICLILVMVLIETRQEIKKELVNYERHTFSFEEKEEPEPIISDYNGEEIPTAYCQEGIEYLEGYNIHPYRVVLLDANGNVVSDYIVE